MANELTSSSVAYQRNDRPSSRASIVTFEPRAAISAALRYACYATRYAY